MNYEDMAHRAYYNNLEHQEQEELKRLCDIARKLERWEIEALLEDIGICCYDNEPTQLLIECLAENVLSGNIEEYQLTNE